MKTEIGATTDLVHTVKRWPVGLTVADTLAKVHEIITRELDSSEEWNEFLNILQNIPRWHFLKKRPHHVRWARCENICQEFYLPWKYKHQ